LRTDPADYPKYEYKETDTAGVNKASFKKVNDMLIAEVIDELPKMYALPPAETQWIANMLEYNVKGGKMNRGLTVVDSGVAIFEAKGLTVDNTALVRFAILGWAIEWLQAWLLIADDIMDDSETRRGQLCWYKKLQKYEQQKGSGPHDIWYIAINDAVTIEALVYKIIKRHFSSDPYYVQLLDLMMETTLQTELGQLSDTLCDTLDLKDLTTERWNLIVTYKTAFYSFYLSVAFAMTVAGIADQAAYDTAREILIEMGVYFQAQDDYLDCFGTHEQIGKIGTDIADKKCGWLFTLAYHELCTPEQKALLDTHYGKCKVKSKEEAEIKQLYKELQLEERYKKYEQASYDKIMGLRESAGARLAAAGVPWVVFEKFLLKVYKRNK